VNRPEAGGTPTNVASRDSARAAKLEALHATLAEKIAAIRHGADWRNWLNVAARFHAYSFNNQILIAAQRPEATAVAGFEAWKALGRQVNKGERGIQILAPVLLRSAPEAPVTPQPAGVDRGGTESKMLDGEKREQIRIAAFRVVHVFDVEQTSGTPLPERPVPQLLLGQAPAGLWDALATQVSAQGFTLQRGDCGAANGVTNYRLQTVTIRPDVDDAQAVKTLCHELAHVLLHDPAGEPLVVPSAAMVPLGGPTAADSSAQCRGCFEVEAESVAYLIAAVHGLDTAAYTFPYVAGWAGSVDAVTPDRVVHATAQRVLGAARKILTATEALDADIPSRSDVPQMRVVADTAVRAEQAQERTLKLVAAIARTDQVVQRQLESPVVPRRALRSGPVPTTAVVPVPADERLVHVHDLAVEFYRQQLHTGDAASLRATEVLHQRGVPPEAILQAGLGYAPRDWTQLVDHLRQHGIGDDELIASGLVLPTSRGTLVDRFRERIIFPVADGSGRNVALLGRSVARSSVDRNGNRIPKYLNSPETALYRKGHLLYGLATAAPALAAGALPVLVEGPMDVLAVNCAGQSPSQLGAPDVPTLIGVAPCGTGLTTRQVALLDHATDGLADRGVLVAFDGDPAGRAAAVRAFELLRPTGAWPQSLSFAEGIDPALLLQRQGPDALRSALHAADQHPLADLVVDECIDRYGEQLRWAEGQVTACRSAATLIATLPPEHVARQVGRLVNRLDLPYQEVNAMIVEAVSNPSGHTAGSPRSVEPSALQVGPSSGALGQQSAAQRTQAAFPVPLRDALRRPSPAAVPGLAEQVREGLGQPQPVRRQA
jgi:DNA primase catalytic core